MNKKQLPRNGKLVQRKTRPRMKYERLGKTIQKESDPINKKTVKIKMKLPHVNKKPLATKQIFLQTPISHSTLKKDQKILRRKTIRSFAPLPVSA